MQININFTFRFLLSIKNEVYHFKEKLSKGIHINLESDMVTMSSEKSGSRRKPDLAGNKTGRRLSPTNITDSGNSDDSPNHLVYKKMEQIVEKMQDENSGVPVKTVKSFMSKIPSVFTGGDLILWMTKNLDVDDQVEALHLAHLMASHGYFFPIDDHALTVKNDNSFYRFQTPYFWPSNCWEPENTDYGNFLLYFSFLFKLLYFTFYFS